MSDQENTTPAKPTLSTPFYFSVSESSPLRLSSAAATAFTLIGVLNDLLERNNSTNLQVRFLNAQLNRLGEILDSLSILSAQLTPHEYFVFLEHLIAELQRGETTEPDTP